MFSKLLIGACLVAVVATECAPKDKDRAKIMECVAAINSADDDCKKTQAALDCSKTSHCYDEAACEAAQAAQGCNIDCSSKKCFPATSMVELEGGKKKSMDQLVVGDKVRVGADDFSEVYVFSTSMADTSSKFVKISTDYTQLSLTPGHYLYVNGKQVQAETVKIGDTVVLANGTKALVTAVDEIWGPGLYNPHTLHGDIVVDGVLTTTYTEAVHPKLAHALLSPVRALYSTGIGFGADFRGAIKALPEWVLQAINA